MKTGRASPTIFDHLEVSAYGEKHPFGDLCQTIVKGNSNLLVRVFDETVKDDVLKALARCEFDIQVNSEGKDIRVKLGTSKKEHVDAALKQVKALGEEFKQETKGVRQEINATLRQLEKILPQEEVRVLQKDLEKLCAGKEAEAKKLAEAKEKEIRSA